MESYKARASIAWVMVLVMLCTTILMSGAQYSFGEEEPAATMAGVREIEEDPDKWEDNNKYNDAINGYLIDWWKLGTTDGNGQFAGNWYYFNPTTKIKLTSGYKNNPYDGNKLYIFGSDGKARLFTGFYGNAYYSSGVKVLYKGWQRINNILYYFNGSSIIQTSGYGTYGGKLHRFASSGVAGVYSGIYGSYYYASGVKQTRYKSTIRKMNNGKIYQFKKDGKVYTGSSWKRVKGKRYYFRSGVALTGWNYVGSYKYYFSSKGVLCQNLIKRFGSSWKKKDLKIKVNRKKNCITIYAKDGNNGYTIPVKAITCSVGKKKTPTIKGTFYVNKSRTYRWSKLGGPTMGGYCYGQYCSRITGGFLFHSVLYKKPNKRTLSAGSYNNLGKAASHGCIRLRVADAKLIYDIARYNKTTVTIYDSKKTGPFDKPKLKKIRAGQKYDPSDPNI